MEKNELIKNYQTNPDAFMGFPFNLKSIMSAFRGNGDSVIKRSINTSHAPLLIFFISILFLIFKFPGLLGYFFLFAILYSLCYGYYLFATNKAILYASKNDVVNQISIIGIPLLAFGFIYILDLKHDGFFVIALSSVFVPFFYFGFRSSHSNTVLNNPLSDFQLFCINTAKFCLVFLGLLNMSAAYQKLRNDLISQGKAPAWLFPNTFNFNEVMKKR